MQELLELVLSTRFSYSLSYLYLTRRGGRVVECGRLESDYPFTGIEGSNPSLSSSLRQSASRRTWLRLAAAGKA